MVHLRIVILAFISVIAVPRIGLSDERARQTGRVEGTITYRGKVPKNRVADRGGRNHDLFVVHPENGGLKDAVVYLTFAGEKRDLPPKVGNDLKRKPEKEDGSANENSSRAAQNSDLAAVIDQKDYVFTPHLVAVRAGAAVKFTNSDPANHNVHAVSLERANEFNVFTGSGSPYVHRFKAERRNRLVRIGCDLHPWMVAWVYAFDHPWFAVTDEQGKFRIEGAPAGLCTLSVRQPDGGLSADREVKIETAEPAEIAIELEEKTPEPKTQTP